MKFIKHEGKEYPEFQGFGNASQFILPFAKYFCKGKGYDIGFNREEWKLPGAIGIDDGDMYNAMNLGDEEVDYIYSSHCLEHLDSWVEAIEYWTTRIKLGGTLFLYLPDYSQTYWRPWNNRKHKHIIDPYQVEDLLEKLNYSKILTSGVDFNNSYSVVGIK